MVSNLESAMQFFEACETGKSWEVCQAYCHPDATFSVQAAILAEVTSLEGYVEWARSILTPIPDGHYELKFRAEDPDTNSVAVVSVFHGTHTGPEGPVEATGQKTATEYVYHMAFDGDRIKHMTKIWNDSIALQQLGWA